MRILCLLMLCSVLILSGCASKGTTSNSDKEYKTYTSGTLYKNKKTGQVYNINDNKDLLKVEADCREFVRFLFRDKLWDREGIQIGVDDCLDKSGYERVK